MITSNPKSLRLQIIVNFFKKSNHYNRLQLPVYHMSDIRTFKHHLNKMYSNI